MKTWKRPKGLTIIRAQDIPPGPRGLGGYCWHRDPSTGLFCCEPVNRPHVRHYHPYTRTRW